MNDLKKLLARLDGDRFALCRLLGIHEQSYYKYLRGERPVPDYIVAHCVTLESLSNAAFVRRLQAVLPTS